MLFTLDSVASEAERVACHCFIRPISIPQILMFFRAEPWRFLQPYNLTLQALIMRFPFALASVLFMTLLVSAEISKTDAAPSTNELIAEISKLPTCVVRMTSALPSIYS